MTCAEFVLTLSDVVVSCSNFDSTFTDISGMLSGLYGVLLLVKVTGSVLI